LYKYVEDYTVLLLWGDSRKTRKIAQKQVNSKHLIRVVYEEKGDDVVIITFYPARRKRYENKL